MGNQDQQSLFGDEPQEEAPAGAEPDLPLHVGTSITIPEQTPLFDNPPAWTEHWQGMPEYEQKDLMPWQTARVHFRNKLDRQAFANLIDQPISDKTQFIWFPQPELRVRQAYVAASDQPPLYPIYVISKGRWESRLTVKALEKIGVSYRIVVEPQEYQNYADVIDSAKILTLPFSNLGHGSIPARNWVWEHAVGSGAKRHWILDDNINGFCRLHANSKPPMTCGIFFSIIENFVDRYSNIALAGCNYRFFAKQKQDIPPFLLNTRIYSCILIYSDMPYRWRGRYNEDTDLSLQVLKAGMCTVQFNAFLANKQATMTMKGGNTDELYQGDGRRLMAESLQAQHPDVVKITRKWGRWQHHVDYKIFRKNKLILKPGVVIPEGPDNYGMELEVDGVKEKP